MEAAQVNKKKIPLNNAQLEAITAQYPTPFHLYDEKAIRENARAFYKAGITLPSKLAQTRLSWLFSGMKEWGLIVVH